MSKPQSRDLNQALRQFSQTALQSLQNFRCLEDDTILRTLLYGSEVRGLMVIQQHHFQYQEQNPELELVGQGDCQSHLQRTAKQKYPEYSSLLSKRLVEWAQKPGRVSVSQLLRQTNQLELGELIHETDNIPMSRQEEHCQFLAKIRQNTIKVKWAMESRRNMAKADLQEEVQPNKAKGGIFAKGDVCWMGNAPKKMCAPTAQKHTKMLARVTM